MKKVYGYVRVSAKARGVQFGRPASPLPDNFHEVCNRWNAGRLTNEEAARHCGMPVSSFRYRAKNEIPCLIFRNNRAILKTKHIFFFLNFL